MHACVCVLIFGKGKTFMVYIALIYVLLLGACVQQGYDSCLCVCLCSV